MVVLVAQARWKLGDTTPWRQALFDMSWQRWQFWLFSAVGSYIVPPIVEELFYRRYCQRRLAENWGDGAAIIGSAFLFVFSHNQYFRADAYNVGLLCSVFIAAVSYGAVFALTRSVIPSILAHAVIEFPMRPPWQVAALAVLIVGFAFTVRPASRAIKKVFAGTNVSGCVGLAVLGIVYPIVSTRVPVLAFVAVGMVLLAVALEASSKRQVESAPFNMWERHAASAWRVNRPALKRMLFETARQRT